MDYGQLVSMLDEMGLGGDADQDQARIDALRKQQMIGAMGGVMDVPGTQKMGQAMFQQASNQLGELQSPDRPLARALAQAKVAEALHQPGVQPKHLEDGWFLMPDGSVSQHPGMAAAAKAGDGALDPSKVFTQEDSLRKQFRADTKDHQTISSAWDKIRTSLSGTGASDMSMIFSYMKILDPNSTVREGEYASAQNTANVPEQIRAQYNRAVKEGGPILTQTQRKNFVNQAGSIYNTSLDQFNQTRQEYTDLAGKYGGIQPERVTLGRGGTERYDPNAFWQAQPPSMAQSQLGPNVPAGLRRDENGNYYREVPD